MRNAECGVRSFSKITKIIFLTLLFMARIAIAQEADLERDPFYPSAKRPTAAAQPRNADWGKDPFSNPLTGKGASQPDQNRRGSGRNISGIVYSTKVRLAIIGGEALSEGSMVGEQRLVDIRKRSIVLMSPGGSLEEIFLDDFSIRK